MLHALLPANRKTHKNITWWQPNHHSLSKWLTVCTRQDLGREHSIPQYVTLTLDVYQVCHAVSCWVIDGSCSSSSVERKANGQYCWDILISQQMILNDTGDNFCLPTTQCTGASCIQRSPTAAVQNFSTSFLLRYGRIIVQSLIPLNMRFRESIYSSICMSYN